MQRNIETILRNAKQVEVPKSTFDKVDNVLRNLEQRKDIKNMKPKYRKPIAFAAAVAAMLIVFTTTALAVSGVVDFGAFFRSMFDNEAVAPYIITGDDIGGNVDNASNDRTGIDNTAQTNENEIDVELLSAFIDDTQGGGLYLKLKIHDPTGERLSDSFVLILHDEETVYEQLNMDVPSDMRQWLDADTSHSPNDGAVFIDEYTVHADFFIPSWKPFSRNEAGDIVVRFDFIASNIQNVTIPTGFNVGEHFDMEDPIALPGAEFVQITGMEFGSEHFGSDKGLTIFHSDTTADPLRYGWGAGLLSLVKSNGERIGLSGARNHFLSNNSFSVVSVESRFGVENLNLNDLTLVWRGDMAEFIIPGNWEFTIATNNVALQPGVFRGSYEEYQVEVDISTTLVIVRTVPGLHWETVSELFDEDSLVLYMADGTEVLPKLGGREGSSMTYYMDFIAPEEVVRVIFRGVELSG